MNLGMVASWACCFVGAALMIGFAQYRVIRLRDAVIIFGLGMATGLIALLLRGALG